MGVVMKTIAITTMLAALVLAPVNSAAETRAPTLRPVVTVDDKIVTLGDLLDGAEDVADAQAFRAPSPGTRGHVAVDAILAVAARHGLTGIETGDISQVSVGRAARHVSSQEITAAILRTLVARGILTDAEMVEFSTDEPIDDQIVSTSRTAPVEIGVRYASPANGRFTVSVRLADGAPLGTLSTVSGRAVQMIEMPVLVEPVARGDILAERYFVRARVPLHAIGADAARDVSDLIGKMSRRALRIGAVVAESDVIEPIAVERNDEVTIIYRSGSILLRASGRALRTATKGEVISVVNLQSERTISARVIEPGVVEVSGPAIPLAATTGQARN